MLCDVCNKNIATVHLTEIIKDKIVELHICQNCAKVKTQELTSELIKKQKKEDFLKCSFCGLTYAEFVRKGMLGCRACYGIFKMELIPILEKVHGSHRYAGKSPAAIAPELAGKLEIEELKGKMDQAVSRENYEEAAGFRDRIEKLKSKGN